MNEGMRNRRLTKTGGDRVLMKEERELLDQLKFEMEIEVGRDADVEKDYIVQVMTGVENRMEDMKWPVRMNERMEEVDKMVKIGETSYSYSGGDRLDGGERIKEKKKEKGEHEYNERRRVEDIDDGERVLTPVDEDVDDSE